MQPSVQFVLTLSGVRSSPLILMSSPGFCFTGVQRPRVEWVGGVESNINTPTQTSARNHEAGITSAAARQILGSRGNSQRSAHQSWQQGRLWDNPQDPTCTAARLISGMAVT